MICLFIADAILVLMSLTRTVIVLLTIVIVIPLTSSIVIWTLVSILAILQIISIVIVVIKMCIAIVIRANGGLSSSSSSTLIQLVSIIGEATLSLVVTLSVSSSTCTHLITLLRLALAHIKYQIEVLLCLRLHWLHVNNWSDAIDSLIFLRHHSQVS